MEELREWEESPCNVFSTYSPSSPLLELHVLRADGDRRQMRVCQPRVVPGLRLRSKPEGPLFSVSSLPLRPPPVPLCQLSGARATRQVKGCAAVRGSVL